MLGIVFSADFTPQYFTVAAYVLSCCKLLCTIIYMQLLAPLCKACLLVFDTVSEKLVHSVNKKRSKESLKGQTAELLHHKINNGLFNKYGVALDNDFFKFMLMKRLYFYSEK